MECAVMRTFVRERSIAAGLAPVSAAGVLRLIDIFVLRLDEAWGEIIVSKVAAVVVLLGFVGVTGAGWSAAGSTPALDCPASHWAQASRSPPCWPALVQKFLLQEHRGQAPALKVLAVDPKSGLAGAAGFALVLFIGNLVNSFAEEDLLRGVLIPLFLREAAPWAALLPVRMTIFILVMCWASL
jgi:hypothetical protein